jgi:3-oxoacyl-[acyl-carrier protein] reductase
MPVDPARGGNVDTGLKGKTVLITGASRNMGRVAALAFAREGANLALCTSSKMKELGAVAEEARAFGVSVVAEQCDVTDGAAVAAFVGKTRDKLGGVDVAINIAGFRNEAKFLEGSLEEWTRNIEVNLNGPFHVCRNVIPLMIERRWGRIINLSGVAPYLGGGAAKSMVKLGIVGLTRGLAREFAPHNITANCIGPGSIAREREAHETEKSLNPIQPIRRKGRAEEVTALMVHLASEHAGFITGQCYLVNGGAYFS